MFLTDEEKRMLAGDHGPGIQRAMDLLVKLGESFDAEKGKEVGRQVVTSCYERGVIVVSFGDNIVNFGPPLIITKDDLDIILDTMEWAIQGIQTYFVRSKTWSRRNSRRLTVSLVRSRVNRRIDCQRCCASGNRSMLNNRESSRNEVIKWTMSQTSSILQLM